MQLFIKRKKVFKLINETIDFVVTWVDGLDKEWQNKRKQYLPENEQMNSEIRFRDYDTLKFWFRLVEKHAPWVNKVYLITDNQVPKWLDTSQKQIICVDHQDYIPKKYLPTFNSNVIELNLDKIDTLSEKFVLFNDDVFLNKSVVPEDFFLNGVPKDFGILSPIVPEEKAISHIEVNNIEIINKYFDKKRVLKANLNKFFTIKYGKNLIRTLSLLPYPKFNGFFAPHVCQPHLKSNFTDLWKKEFSRCDLTSRNRFRTERDINHWLIRYFNLCTGNFVPQSRNFGSYFELDDIEGIKKELLLEKSKLICINDSEKITAFDEKKQELHDILVEKVSQKSHFEI